MSLIFLLPCLDEKLTKLGSIMFTALFGVFGKMFINENPEGDSGIQQMKNAVWVDLGKMIHSLTALGSTNMLTLSSEHAPLACHCHLRCRHVLYRPQEVSTYRPRNCLNEQQLHEPSTSTWQLTWNG